MADQINQTTNLTPALIDTYELAYNRYINQAQDNLSGIYSTVTTYKQTIEDYWIGDVDKSIIENPGAPTFSELEEEKVTLRSKKYTPKNGIRIHREREVPEYEGMFTQRINSLFSSIVDFPNREIIRLIEAGETNKAWDKQNYFTKTVAGKRENANLMDGAGVTEENIDSDFAKALAAFKKFKSQGTPINVAPTVILVPTDLEVVFSKLMNSTATPVDNKNSGVRSSFNVLPTLQLITSVHLTDPNDWYLFDTSLVPMLWASWQQKNNDGASFTDIRLIVDETRYNLDGYKQYSVSRWGGAQYGHPVGAFKVKNS